MRRYYLLIGIIIGILPVKAQQITLESLIQKARWNSPQQAQNGLIADATKAKIKELSGSYLPQASLGGQATWQSDVTSINISLPNVNILPPPKDQYKFTLDLTQNIYDGGLTARQKELAEASKSVEESRVATDLQQIDEQVSNLYFGVLLASKQAANSEIMLNEINQRIEKSKAAVDNGVAIRSQLLNLQAKKLELEQLIGDLSKRQNAALEGLSILSGENISSIENFTVPDLPEYSPEINNRAELQFLSAQQEQLRVSEGLVKAKGLPKLGLFATGGYGRPALNFLARDFKTYFIGGAQLKVPLSQFYTGAQSSEIQQLKINQLRLDKQKENFLMATEVRYASQKRDIERLKSQLVNDDKLIAIREEIRKTAEAQLDNGVITATDYLTELDQEDTARQNKALHEIQLLQAKQILKLLLGQ